MDSLQNSHQEKADDQAKAEPAEEENKQASMRRGFFSMSNFIVIAFLTVGAILVGIAINYHTKGGYESIRIASLWGIIGYAFLGVGFYFAYYEYVVKPSRVIKRTPAPDISVRADRAWLTVEAVAASPFTFNSGPFIVADNNTAQLVVRFIITNTGQSPANGAIVKAEIIFPKPENTITDSLKRQREMCRERGNRRDQVMIFNKPETVDITFLLSIDKMIAQFAGEKRKWAKPILVGCVDYLVDGTSHQTGFIYDILRLGAGGQSQRVINIGEDVPINQLLFLKSPFGGDYAN